MSQSRNKRNKIRRLSLSVDEKSCLRNIRKGKYPRWLFGHGKQIKLMLRRGVWSFGPMKLWVGKWIPVTSTFFYMTGKSE